VKPFPARFLWVKPSLGFDPGGELRAAFENGDRC
jgi:hypothetical protein